MYTIMFLIGYFISSDECWIHLSCTFRSNVTMGRLWLGRGSSFNHVVGGWIPGSTCLYDEVSLSKTPNHKLLPMGRPGPRMAMNMCEWQYNSTHNAICRKVNVSTCSQFSIYRMLDIQVGIKSTQICRHYKMHMKCCGINLQKGWLKE